MSYTIDDAIKAAVERVKRDRTIGCEVFTDRDGAVWMQATNAARRNGPVTVHAVVEWWDDNTLQVREPGARSTFIKVAPAPAHRYDDCADRQPGDTIAGDDEAVTCSRCRRDLGLDPVAP